MQPKAGSFAGGYQFIFAGLPENVEYYVTAGAMTSEHFQIRVTDLPAVKQIRVTYHFPPWTGMPSEVEERSGDLRAVTGTLAELQISTDRPLQGGKIQLDSGAQIQLAGGDNNVYRGTVRMDKDGVYHIAGIDGGQPVRVSEDFFIEARKPNPPQVSLVRPSRGDYHANPVEEVTVAAKASGDYGLHGVELHYSVNGGRRRRWICFRKKVRRKPADRRRCRLKISVAAGRSGQRLRHRQGRQRRSAHGHDVHPGRPVRTRIFAIAGGRRRRRRRRRAGQRPGADLAARERDYFRHLQTTGDKNATQQQADAIAKLLAQSQATLRIRRPRFRGACRLGS